MLNKKKITKPTKHDEAALSAAMKELSKQTEALLGSSEPKKAPPVKKPQLPKKQSLQKSRGKSFDIISQPKHPRKLKATLKTVEPKLLKPVHTTSPQHQISEHVSKKSTLTSGVQTAKSLSTSSRSAVAPTIVHQKGRLQIQPQPAETDQASIVTNEPKEAPSASVARTGIIFSEEDTQEVIEQTPSDDDGATIIEQETDDVNEWIGESSSHTNSQKSVEEEDSQVAAEVKVFLAFNMIRVIHVLPKACNDLIPTILKTKSPTNPRPIAATNLIDQAKSVASNKNQSETRMKAKKPKGYQPLASQQKPTVFDTNEYHVDLHDWSKLDHSANSKWILFVLVAVLLGAFVYLIVLKQPVPFVSSV